MASVLTPIYSEMILIRPKRILTSSIALNSAQIKNRTMKKGEDTSKGTRNSKVLLSQF